MVFRGRSNAEKNLRVFDDSQSCSTLHFLYCCTQPLRCVSCEDAGFRGHEVAAAAGFPKPLTLCMCEFLEVLDETPAALSRRSNPGKWGTLLNPDKSVLSETGR